MNFNDLNEPEIELIELLRSLPPYSKVEINLDDKGKANTLRVHTSRTAILKGNIGKYDSTRTTD